jgi:glycosyltransferase involved in cell wall biosynthesis
MPKVSVIIPVYGVENYIEKCARSLFEQTLNEIEYIFIDDCTPDHSIDILKDVLNDYPNRKDQVIIHHMPTNSGQAAVREWGMKNCKGDYIIHCDSDDWVEINAYELLLHKAIEEDADIVFCDYYLTDGLRKISEFKKNIMDLASHNILRILLTKSNLNPLWSAMVKKKCINNLIYPTESQAEDKALMVQMCYKASSFAYLKKSLYYYRTNPNSICNNFEMESLVKRYHQYVCNINLIVDFLENRNLHILYKQEIVACKFAPRHLLENLINNSKCSELWLSSYPEINKNILLNPYVTIKDKIRFIYFYLVCLTNSIKKRK